MLNLSLKNLDIRGNLIGDKGAKYLGRGLEGNTSLKQILLDKNKIGYLGASAIGKETQIRHWKHSIYDVIKLVIWVQKR